MRIKTSKEVLLKALERVNKHFSDNVLMEMRENGKWFIVRLKTKGIGLGARRGFSKRYIKNACWHAYGFFIESIFEFDPNAIVYSINTKFTKENWYWKDWNIGSMINPLYYSEACYCGEFNLCLTD